MGEDNTYTAAIPGGQFGVTHVPAAVPKGDLEWPVDRAWHWKSAATTVERHIAHEICFAASSDLDAIELRLLHSRIIAGLAVTGGASAVYVGSASLVRDAVAYIDDLENSSHDNLPLLSWGGIQSSKRGWVLCGVHHRSGRLWLSGSRDAEQAQGVAGFVQVSGQPCTLSTRFRRSGRRRRNSWRFGR